MNCPVTPYTTENILQQLSNQTDEAQTDDGRVDVDVDGGAAGVAAAGGAVTLGAASVGLGVVGSASELALDGAVTALGAGGVLLQSSAGVGDVTSGGQSKGTLDIVERGEIDPVVKTSAFLLEQERPREGLQNLLAEVTTKLDGTTDISQLGEASDLLEGGVVDNRQTTTNGGDGREGDVGKISVVDERNVTRRGLGHVGGREALEVVGVESGGSIDNLERGGGELGDVGNGHVGDPDEVGERHAESLTVGLDVEVGGQVLELGLELGQTTVVVDVHGANGLQVNTIQVLEESVRDSDTLSRADTGGEGELVQSGQRLPLDGANARQVGEAQGGQESHVGEREGSGDGGQGVRGESNDGTVVLHSQVATDRGRAGDVESVVRAGGDDDGTRDCVTVREGGGLGGCADCVCGGGASR